MHGTQSYSIELASVGPTSIILRWIRPAPYTVRYSATRKLSSSMFAETA
jgi:hypothetical protein